MGIRVEVLEHGAGAMWIALGPIMSSRTVVKELAGPIFSGPTTTWLVARDASGTVVGVASLRDGGDVWWCDYGYVLPAHRRRGVFARLAKTREKLAARSHKACRALIQERRWPHYEERGWSVLSRRGSWLTIERSGS